MPRHTTTVLLLLLFSLALAGCRDEAPNDDGPAFSYQSGEIVVPVGLIKSPRGIAVDNTGDIWISDSYSNSVRRMTPQGSDKFLLTGIPFPTSMGFNRSTNNILFVSNRRTIFTVDPSNDFSTVLFDFAGAPIDTSALFNITTGGSSSRSLSTIIVGDLDGSPNGDVFVSVLANSGENFLVRIRNGNATAVMFSPLQPSIQEDRAPRFLSVDRFGVVYTSFVTAGSSAGTTTSVFSVMPGNLNATQRFTSVGVTPAAQGSGIDANGRLFICEPGTGHLVLLSTTQTNAVDFLFIPVIQGMTQPAPRDAAVAPNGDVYVAVSDLLDTSNQIGAIIVFRRR